MAGNSVVVQLIAKDGISGTIGSIKNNIKAGIGDAIGTIATMTAAIAAAGIAMSNLGQGLGTAMTMQTQNISTVYGLANVMGTTLSDARSATKELTKSITEMGDSLPGVTEDYNKYAQALSTTIAFGAKGDMSAYKKMLTETSKYSGLLGSTMGIDSTQGAAAANKFLSGGMSINEAFNTSDLFQRNQDFKAYLNMAQSQLGLAGKDFQKQLTTEQRAAVFALAGSLKFPPEMVAAFKDTADTQMQAIKSRLFNPVTGIFGFMRQIKGLDDRTALDTVGTFLGQVTQLGDTASKWLASKGIVIDPMEAIGRTIDGASAWVNAFNAAIGGDGSGLETMLGFLRKTVMDFPGNLARNINVMLAGVATLTKRVTPKQIGSTISEFFNNTIAAFRSIRVDDVIGGIRWMLDSFSSMLSGTNWTSLGEGLGSAIGKILTDEELGKSLERSVAASLTAFAQMIYGALAGAVKEAVKSISGEGTGLVGRAAKSSSGVATGGLNMPSLGGMITDFGVRSAEPVKKFFGIGNERSSADGTPVASLPTLDRMANTNSRTSNVFSPQIALYGGATQEQADYILNELNKQFVQYRDAAIA